MQIELPEWSKKFLRPVKRTLELYLTYNHDYRRWYRQNFHKLSSFQDRHQGESCFIMGNGPSLNKMDLAPLRQRYTFGLNKIYLMFDKIDLNLSYHVATDPYVIEQSIQPFLELSCPTFICWRSGKDYFPNCDHVNFIRVDDSHETFTRDITKEIWDGGSVTYVAMQIAFYMGFSSVYLIGVDHSYHGVSSVNEWEEITDHDPNHFDHTYYSRDQRWFPPDLKKSELAYSMANFAYECSGRKILDATTDGKLTIFNKIPYEEALQKSTKRRASC